MYKKFTFQNIEHIKNFLYYSRGIAPISFKEWSFKQGTLDNIAIVEFKYFLGIRTTYIVDMVEYFYWINAKERKLKINKLKGLI